MVRRKVRRKELCESCARIENGLRLGGGKD